MGREGFVSLLNGENVARFLDSVIRFEGYTIDDDRLRLFWQGGPVALSQKTFDVLLYLIDHRGQLLSKERLLSDLWPKQVVEESNLTQQIFLLRKALSQPGSGKFIETIGRKGYRFTAEIEVQQATLVLNARSSVSTITVEEEVTLDTKSSARVHFFRLYPRVFWAAGLCLAGVIATLGNYEWHAWEIRTAGQPVAVVLADFDVTGGDVALSHALDSVLRIDLKQSPFVTVVSPGKMKATLIAMREAKDATVTPEIAREVCERTAAQVVLQGSASKFGAHYLVSLRATGCLHGELLAEEKNEVDREDDMPKSLEDLAGTVRRKLGESRESIGRFDKPLSTMRTGSLAALKAYTAGRSLFDHGDYQGALPLLQKAVELDPNFGDAYIDITAVYFNLGDMTRASQSLTKAYLLRASMGQNNQLYTTALYHQIVDQDLEAGLVAYKAYAAISPTEGALGMLAAAYDELGQASLGIEPAQRAVNLSPKQQSVYVILSAAQLHSGKLADAAHTEELAIANGCDGDSIRDLIFQTDYANHDESGVTAQLVWAHTHNDSVATGSDAIFLALAKGENRRAQALLDIYEKRTRPAELQTLFDNNLSIISRMQADEGLSQDSNATLQSISSGTLNENLLVAMAEDGMTSQAIDLLHRALLDHPNGTRWKHVGGPQVQAALRLAANDAQQASVFLEPAVGWERIAFGTTYLRGMAFLKMGRFHQAVDEFKRITDSQWLDPLSNLYPLSYLQLARAYRQASDVAAARVSYAQFLALWKTADVDSPLLIDAKTELSAMR